MRLDEPRFLFVFAHPDDETFCCGGTIAFLRRSGARVTLVCATMGDKGKTGDPKLWKHIGLARLRRHELGRAANRLGVNRIVDWHYKDKRLAEAEAVATRRVLKVLRDIKPFLVISFGPDGFSGHADHCAISRITLRAFRAWKRSLNHRAELLYAAFPRTSYSLAKLPLPRGHRPPEFSVDVRSTLRLKLAALEEYRSQPITRARLRRTFREKPSAVNREWYRHAAGDRIASQWGFRPV